jgi:hypothetical protein
LKTHFLAANLVLIAIAGPVSADSTEAVCEIYPSGENHTDVMIPCTFS